MDDQIVTIYCLCDDFLQAIGHQEDRQCQMNDAEVMTTAIVASQFFSGNYESARGLLKQPQYIPDMLSKSRFCRRLHRTKGLFLPLFCFLGEVWKELSTDSVYIIDTFPIPVCDNYRIPRAKIYQSETYRGYIASKKRYFYGLKIHIMVTKDGQPVEFFLTPGSIADVTGLQLFDFDLPEGAEVYADKAYNDYTIEDVLKEAGINLLPIRKKNSKRKPPPWLAYLQSRYRKIVETAGSLIEQKLPKSIHAVTATGFELKVALFVLGLSLSHLLKVAT